MAVSAASAVRVAADEAQQIGVEAYVYLFPLVLMEITRRQMTNAPAGIRLGFGPMGTFAHAREFPPAEFRAVVRPNFDTLYSIAWLDLTGEPTILSVPDTAGRYYMLPLLDMWTDVFAVPGKRATGTGAGHFAVVPPGWTGELPGGVQRIQAPTRYVWAIGRTQTNGTSDYDAVHVVQDGFAVTPLSDWVRATSQRDPRPSSAAGGPTPTINLSIDMTTPPLDQVFAMPAVDFFALAGQLLELHSPHVTDWSTVARLGRIGLQPGRSFIVQELDPTLHQALETVPEQARQLMLATYPRIAKVVNGWQMNTDTMGVYGDFYLKRAIVAMIGLGANQPEDAIYPLNVTDAEGQPVNGNHDYVLHFDTDELPPVAAFWSVTMYDAAGFQTANPLNRFAIGDRDDLTYNEDGSLDLYLQTGSPGPEKESNWLPSPRGPLGITLRLYAPAPEALDGRWNPPAIRRARSRD